jgi:hypothetical protein
VRVSAAPMGAGWGCLGSSASQETGFYSHFMMS